MTQPDERAFSFSFSRLVDEARACVGTEENPVMVRRGDALVWVQGASRVTQEVVGRDYHLARRLAHVPVALFAGATHGAAPGDLEDAVGLLASSRDGVTIGRQEVSAALLQSLHDGCAAFLEDRAWHAAGCPSHAAVLALIDRCRPCIDALVTAAATHEVEQLHAQVQARREATKPDRWRRAWFVVVTGMQPRYRELSLQYFQAMLDAEQPFAGHSAHRTLVLTGDLDDDEVLDRVATREANRRIARTFTGSPGGLDEDVLARAAERAVKEVLGERPDVGAAQR